MLEHTNPHAIKCSDGPNYCRNTSAAPLSAQVDLTRNVDKAMLYQMENSQKGYNNILSFKCMK